MNKQPTKSKHTWARFALYGFWGALGLFAVLLISQYGSASTAQAATEAGKSFAVLVCGFYSAAGAFVFALTVLMIVAAGIVYGTSQGQSGGEGSGIGLAKSMIISAVSGALLYVLGFILLGSCGTTLGGLVGQLKDFFL